MENLSADARFEKLGLNLPPAPAPLGVYKPYLIDGKYLYLSGHGPVQDDKSLIIGRIGSDLNQDEGKVAAKQVGLTMLSTIKTNLGSLDKIKRVIKVLGMVNCTPDFEKHPFIINGCSELFAEVCKLLMDAGISKFKCATIAEAEMLALCGAADVLLAYQPIGPNVNRFITLQQQYPLTRFSCLVDNETTAQVLATLSQSNKLKSVVFIDVNVGMDRTGILPVNVLDLYAKLAQMEGLILKGLHAYDGHIHDSGFPIRSEKARTIIDVLNYLSAEINSRLKQQPVIVAGGTPTFTIYNTQTAFDCSPGTFALWDKGYQDAFEEQHFFTAALVVSRIVSLPGINLICCDLGHKAVAAEKPLDKRVAFLNAPELIPVSQSEEHLVLDAGENHSYQIGDLLYGLPYHICPTVALYENATSVSSAHADQIWNISSRKRKITI